MSKLLDKLVDWLLWLLLFLSGVIVFLLLILAVTWYYLIGFLVR